MRVALKTFITISITLLSAIGAFYIAYLYTDLIKRDVLERSQKEILRTIEIDKPSMIKMIQLGTYLNLNQHLKSQYGQLPHIENVEVILENEVLASYQRRSESGFSGLRHINIPLSDVTGTWGHLSINLNQAVIDKEVSSKIKKLYLTAGFALSSVIIIAFFISSLISKEVSKIFLLINRSHLQIKDAKNLADLEKSLTNRPRIKSFLLEISSLTKVFDDFLVLIKDANKKLYKLENEILLAQQAQQIAHDIRSPLDVLRGVKKEIQDLPSDSRARIEMSISRIEEIATNLLKTNQKSLMVDPTSPQDLLVIANEVIKEKELEFGTTTHLKLVLVNTLGLNSYISKIHISAFKSLLSNLINNSAEAIATEQGTITIDLNQDSNFNILRVIDTGCGIPVDIQAKIFSRGFTSKLDGNGLGLYGAKEELKSLGGNIELETSFYGRTVFKITVPIHYAPRSVVLIDDTKLFRIDWESYCSSKNIQFKSYESIENFLADSSAISSDSYIYIDSDLGNGIKGEVESEKVFEAGYTNLFLATGLPQEYINKPKWIKGVFSKNPRDIF